MEAISWILYGAFVIIFTFFGNVTFNHKIIENKLTKFIICLFSYPLMGLIFWIFGWIFTFLSKLILMPFKDLFL